MESHLYMTQIILFKVLLKKEFARRKEESIFFQIK